MAGKVRLEDRECPLSATLGVVGEWWTLLILHDAFDGYTRFDQFQGNLRISSSILTIRLRTLTANGLLERRRYQTHPDRYEHVRAELQRVSPLLITAGSAGAAVLVRADAHLAPHDLSRRLQMGAPGGGESVDQPHPAPAEGLEIRTGEYRHHRVRVGDLHQDPVGGEADLQAQRGRAVPHGIGDDLTGWHDPDRAAARRTGGRRERRP
ncbi:winged helix-turn-helix transcriptional regulator [Micromonospora sp. CPCC 205739]